MYETRSFCNSFLVSNHSQPVLRFLIFDLRGGSVVDIPVHLAGVRWFDARCRQACFWVINDSAENVGLALSRCDEDDAESMVKNRECQGDALRWGFR